MRTSAIQHPKRSYYSKIHDWQFKLFNKDFSTCSLMSYLEHSFNLMLEEPKNRGWIHYRVSDLIQYSYCSSKKHLNECIAKLEAYEFVNLSHPEEYPASNESFIWIYFNALKVNSYVHGLNPVQNTVVSIDPFMKLAWLLCLVQDANKGRRVYKSEIQEIFEFWKITSNHLKSKIDNKTHKLILEQLKLGYTKYDLAKAIYGLRFSSHHMGLNCNGTRYDHIRYALKDAAAIDRFSSLVDTNSPNFDIEKYYDECIVKGSTRVVTTYSHLK